MRIKSYLIIILLFNLNSCFLFEEPDLCSESHTCPLTDVERKYLEEILDINGLDPSLAQYYSVKAKDDLQSFRLNNLDLTSFRLPDSTPSGLNKFTLEISDNKIKSDSLFIVNKYWMKSVHLGGNSLTYVPKQLCQFGNESIYYSMKANQISSISNILDCVGKFSFAGNKLCSQDIKSVQWLTNHSRDGIRNNKWSEYDQNCD